MPLNVKPLTAALSTLALGAGLTLMAVTPASAATVRCTSARVGAGGYDTFQVCVTVGLKVVESRATLTTGGSRSRVQINVALNRDGSEIRSAYCYAVQVAPNMAVRCDTPTAGNVSGPQTYYATGSVRLNGADPWYTIYTPANGG